MSSNPKSRKKRTDTYGYKTDADRQYFSWNTKLCDCGKDMGSWCLALWCPCIQWGMNQNKFRGNNTCGCCCAYCVLGPLSFILGGVRRDDMRDKYDIEGDACGDVCAHLFCTSCAIAQEARELTHREGLLKSSDLIKMSEKDDAPLTGTGSSYVSVH